MTTDFIQSQVKKRISYQVSLDQFIEHLRRLPHNEWFEPTNKENEDFSFCMQLFEMNLCEKKITPIWNNASFTGNRIAFKINIQK